MEEDTATNTKEVHKKKESSQQRPPLLPPEKWCLRAPCSSPSAVCRPPPHRPTAPPATASAAPRAEAPLRASRRAVADLHRRSAHRHAPGNDLLTWRAPPDPGRPLRPPRGRCLCAHCPAHAEPCALRHLVHPACSCRGTPDERRSLPGASEGSMRGAPCVQAGAHRARACVRERSAAPPRRARVPARAVR